MHISGHFPVYEDVRSWLFGLSYSNDAIIFWNVFLPINNSLFDSINWLLTIYLLGIVARKNAIVSILIILLNIVTSIAITTISFLSSVVGAKVLNVSLYSGRMSLNPVVTLATIRTFLDYAQNASVVMSAFASLIPIGTYLFVLSLFLFYKIVGEILRRGISRFLEVAVDRPVDKFAPFTLFGMVTGLLASILKVSIELVKAKHVP
jgi:hypothetical protein